MSHPDPSKEYHQDKPIDRVIIYEMDGDAWCAHYDDFFNLQESPAGFGYTKEEALKELLKQEAI